MALVFSFFYLVFFIIRYPGVIIVTSVHISISPIQNMLVSSVEPVARLVNVAIMYHANLVSIRLVMNIRIPMIISCVLFSVVVVSVSPVAISMLGSITPISIQIIIAPKYSIPSMSVFELNIVCSVVISVGRMKFIMYIAMYDVKNVVTPPIIFL